MRKITKIIVHCTATKEGQTVTVADVTKWHKTRGFRTIGYHYLIGLNGERWHGRPEIEIGAHCEGHNANSIGVCYVGGLDATLKPKDTRTMPQKMALMAILKELKQKYPQATIHGHREFANKACPCFNVAEYANIK
jgi:N-acetylmuramoyl-L-alanine amidase